MAHQLVIDGASSPVYRLADVSFRNGARTKIHRHSTEQMLIVTAGMGFIETRDERITICAGDVVIIPAGEAHVHGAVSDLAHFSVLGFGNETTNFEDWPMPRLANYTLGC